VDEDLHRLEVGIRQLKVQYDMFFSGGAKRAPVELRWQIEKIMKRYSEKPIRNYAQRFQYNALVGRYNSFAERWGKAVRSMEEGTQRHSDTLSRFAIRERLLTRARFADPDHSLEDLRRLHGRYTEALGRETSRKAPSFDAFLQSIRSKTRRLREQGKCAEIELRVVIRDDRVQLKAKTRRSLPGGAEGGG
jgi:hypothetical protein